MTKEQFIADCKSYGIAHYNRCVRQWKNGADEVLYVVSTPDGHDYLGFRAGTVRCMVWTEQTGWETLFYNLSPHRAKQFLKARKNGRLADIDERVIGNYITNGYSTRRGLFAKYSEKALERMECIASSHADYLGCETGDSKTDHYNRVRMRNR